MKEVLRRFGYQSYTRAEVALCLYWQLAEDHVDEWPCLAFLEQLQGRMSRDKEAQHFHEEEA